MTAPLKIATFNVNGVKGRLPRLLEWLAQSQPDIACLQEIKTGDATFPIAPIEAIRCPAPISTTSSPGSSGSTATRRPS